MKALYRLRWHIGFLLALFLVAVVHDANAQVLAWDRANDACRGEPLLRSNGKDNPACRERDALSRALQRQGYLRANHDVWLSPEQQNWFAQVLRTYDGQTRENLYAAESIMPMMLTELRRKLTDDQIFAIWNEQRPAIQAYAPFGSALMTTLMRKLEMTYARTHDPRYTVTP